MSEFHLSVVLPEDRDERTKVRAKAFALALSYASASPDIRLKMILGEARAQWAELVDWVRREIGKDESKAPGLRELALKKAVDIPLIMVDPGELMLRAAILPDDIPARALPASSAAIVAAAPKCLTSK